MPRILSPFGVSLLTLILLFLGRTPAEAQGLSRTQTPPQYTTTPSEYTTTPPEYIPLPDTVVTVPNNGGQGQGGQNPPNINIPNPTIPNTDPTVPGDGQQPDDGMDSGDDSDESMEDDSSDMPDQSESPRNVERSVQAFGQYVLGLDQVGSQQFVTDFGTLAGQLGFQTEEVDFQTGVRMVMYLTLSRVLGLSMN